MSNTASGSVHKAHPALVEECRQLLRVDPHGGKPDPYLYDVGMSSLELFTRRAMQQHQTRDSAADNTASCSTADMLSELCLARCFNLLVDPQSSSCTLTDREKATNLCETVGRAIVGADYDISGRLRSLLCSMSDELLRVRLQSSSHFDNLLACLRKLSIPDGMTCITTDRVGEFYICYFRCHLAPSLGCIVGDCCPSEQEAERRLAERVVQKIDELGLNRNPKRVRSDVGEPGPVGDQVRWKQKLLMALQKHGLKESLGKALVTSADASRTAASAFYAEFTYPPSLRGSALRDLGTVRGPTCSSKKQAEDTVCKMILDMWAKNDTPNKCG